LDDAWILDGRHAATSLLDTLLHMYAPSRHNIVAHGARTVGVLSRKL